MAAFHMTGPTARLGRLADVLAMAGAQMNAIVSRAAEREVMPLIQQGFATRTDPYGKAWAKPKTPNPPLERSGKGRQSYEIIRTLHQGRWAVMASNGARAKSGGAFYMAILHKGWRDRGGGQNAPRKQVHERAMAPRWFQRLQPACRKAGTAWLREAMR